MSFLATCRIVTSLKALLNFGALSRTHVATNASGEITMSLLSFDANGMDCGSCTATVQRALARLDGVSQSGVRLSPAVANVIADLKRATRAQTEVPTTLLRYPAKARRQDTSPGRVHECLIE